MCGLLFLLMSFHLQPSSTCTYSFQLSQIGKYDFAHFIIFLFACQMVPIPCSHFSWWLFIYSEMLHYYYKASRMEYVRIAERIYRNADPTCFRTTKIWIIMDIIFSLLRSIINCQLHGLLGNGNNSVYQRTITVSINNSQLNDGEGETNEIGGIYREEEWPREIGGQIEMKNAKHGEKERKGVKRSRERMTKEKQERKAEERKRRWGEKRVDRGSLSPERTKQAKRKKINDRHEICKVLSITVVGGTYTLLNLKQYPTTTTTAKVSLCVLASVIQ